MGNLWKALAYGSAKTKVIIISMFILVIGGGVALVLGITNMSMIFLGGGAIALVAGLLIMFSATFTITEKQNTPQNNNSYQSVTEAKRRELLAISSAGYAVKGKNDAILQKEKSELSSRSNSNLSRTNNSNDDSDYQTDITSENDPEDELDAIDTEGLTEEEIEYAKKVNVQRKNSRNKYGIIDIDGSTVEPDKPEQHHIVYQSTDKKSAALRKKLLKVKSGDKKYTPIFVDSCKSLVALRTPAYVQIKGKEAIIMLMERNIRTHTIPLKKFLEVTYGRNVEEKSPETYDILKEDKELYSVFEDLLPTFFPTNNVLSSTMLKNQYILGNDLAITPRSMKNLISKYDFELHLFDALNLKGEYSDYFKMAYENRILWTDNVITQNEYQTRIRNILQMMVDDKEIFEFDFEDDAEMMVRYKLITQEYADFYLTKKRDKLRNPGK